MKKSFNTLYLILSVIALVPVRAQSGSEPSELHMYVFDVGDIQVFDISNWSPGVDIGKSSKFACPAYLIRHPKGDLMWDTGLSDDLANSREGTTNSLYTAKLPKTLSAQFREIEVNPADIDYLAVSHRHSDHIGNANLFRNATLIVQQEEYNAFFEGDEVLPLMDSLKSNKAIQLKGDHDVFGDGTVIIKRAPGHTAGHQMLFVDLPESGPIVLSGDLYHFEKNRRTGAVPSFNYNKEMTLKSMEAMEKFIQKTGATLWIQHDTDQKKVIPLSPKVVR